MKRNLSMQLHKNYSGINKSHSRIQLSPRSRLNFPQIGDSGYYGNVGRKHYEKATHFIHKLILNPDYDHNIFKIEQDHKLNRNKSEGHYQPSHHSANNQQLSSAKNNQKNNQVDSLSQLQREFQRKRSQNRQANLQKPPNSEPITRKDSSIINISSLNHHRKDINGNLFQSLPNRQNISISPRKYNPTYLSSQMGYN